MGRRSSQRHRLYGDDSDKLGAYIEAHHLEAICQRCDHRRDLHLQLLARAFGEDITLGKLRQRLRCYLCGTRRPRLQAHYHGMIARRRKS